MRLSELISGEPIREVDGDTEVEISGIGYDSRETRPGYMFFSLARDAQKNRVNLTDATNRGARVVVVDGWGGGPARPAVTLLDCERPRLLMGVAASRLYRAPSERVNLIGISGTSGKTTTTYLLASIFEAAGLPAGIIGTIGTFVRGVKIYSGLTTPEAPDFEAALARMENEGVGHAFAEISSIGLEEGRVDALNFRAALFTNLGRDHLDYHGTLEAYFAAKLRLFTELLPRSSHPEPLAVIRGDDPYGRRLLEAVHVPKISFGMDPACDVHPLDFTASISGLRAKINALGRKIEISSPLVGGVNLLNVLAASALSVALGIGTDAVVEGVRRCPGAPGRMEAVAARTGVTVLVDYAHKPDALEAALNTVRGLGPKRLICVFGCGGDRDRGKRPIMGQIAGRLADIPIVTSDNPRSEDPLGIIAEIEAGLSGESLSQIGPDDAGARPGYLVEPDRRKAIALALRIASSGDIVIIAGKGHEDYQLVGSRVLRFDDRAVVRELACAPTE